MGEGKGKERREGGGVREIKGKGWRDRRREGKEGGRARVSEREKEREGMSE
jgi:hypothetical protein